MPKEERDINIGDPLILVYHMEFTYEIRKDHGNSLYLQFIRIVVAVHNPRIATHRKYFNSISTR